MVRAYYRQQRYRSMSRCYIYLVGMHVAAGGRRETSGAFQKKAGRTRQVGRQWWQAESTAGTTGGTADREQ